MFVFGNIFNKLFFKLSCVYLLLEKLVKENYFSVKKEFGLIFRKVFFLENLGGKYFPEIVKNLEMS
jgi:hypothetical protein